MVNLMTSAPAPEIHQLDQVSVDYPSSNSTKKLIVYYPTWVIYARQYFLKNIPLNKITHVTLAFVIPELDGKLNSDELKQLNLEELRRYRRKEDELKIGIAVGGWGSCDKFVSLIENEEYKNEFIKNCLNLVNAFALDFLEIDWEYPVDSLQCEKLKLILRRLKEKLPRKFELSICIPCFKSNFIIKDMVELIDFFVLMGYDLCGTWKEKSGYHSALYPNINDHVKYLNSYENIPKEKLVIGCPLYARTFAGCTGNNENHSGGGIGSYGEIGVMDYSEVLKLCKEESFSYDSEAVSEFTSYDNNFLSFDGPKSIEAKCNWILENEFGGIAFWNAAGDGKDENSLILKAANILFK